MSDAKQARRYFVSGVVQGVGFRLFVQDLAEGMGLSGYTRNLRDGRVEAYATGAAKDLATFRLALERGPSGALVSEVTEEPATIEPRFAKGFVITYED